MTDDDLLPDASIKAFHDRAGRGAPRGAGDVLTAARTQAAADEAPGSIGSARRRWATVAAAVVVLAGATAAGGAFAARERDRSQSSAVNAGDPFCDALAEPADADPTYDADVTVYLQPDATQAQVEALRAALDADERVLEAGYVDQVASLERFRELFADQADLLGSVRGEDLPTAFEVDLRDRATAEELATAIKSHDGPFASLGEESDGDAVAYTDGVYGVVLDQIGRARVLDLLVWPGHDQSIRLESGDPAHGLRPYPEGWPLLVGRVRAAADDAALEDAVETLVRRLRSTGRALPEGAARAAEAATVVEAAATERCGLVPGELFTRDVTVREASDPTGATEPSGD